MYKCKKCEFSSNYVSKISNHYKSNHTTSEAQVCEKCNKVLKIKSGYSIHIKFCKGPKVKEIKICPKCNYEIKANYSRHILSCNGECPKKFRKKRGKGWSKGLNKYTDSSLKKISESLLKYNSENIRQNKKHSEETKLLISKLMKDRYNNGWESTAGRCKKLDYISPVAGKIKVDGKWELNTAIYLDSIGVKWIRNKNRFSYYNSIKGTISTYCPDFFVESWNCYIEVKGYITELDKIKWNQFEEKLEVWDKEKLKSLGIDVSYKKEKGKIPKRI